MDTLVIPALERESGKKAGKDFAVCYNPEFMREGTAVADYYAPPFTVIGSQDRLHAQPVAQIYAGIDRPMIHTDIRTAEMLKYICNAYHAVKNGRNLLLPPSLSPGGLISQGTLAAKGRITRDPAYNANANRLEAEGHLRA